MAIKVGYHTFAPRSFIFADDVGGGPEPPSAILLNWADGVWAETVWATGVWAPAGG